MDKKKAGVLEGLVLRLAAIGVERQVLDDETDILWREFDRIADDVAGEGGSFKYVALSAEPPQHIGRVATQTPTSFDAAALERELTAEQWKLVTRQVRVLDATLLEAALAKGKLARDAVAAAQKGGKAYTRRVSVAPASPAEIKEARG